MNKISSAEEIFNKYAHDYESKFMDLSLYHNSFDLFLKSIIKRNAKVLEIGCGPGNISKYLLEQRPDLQLTAIDIAANMIELAKKNCPKAEFNILDARNISSLGKKFDAIISGFCLPYLSREEAEKLIKDCADLLNEDGVLYLSTMEDDYSKSGLKTNSGGDQTMMYYHEAKYLLAAFEKNDFEVIRLLRQDFPSDKEKVTDLIVIAIK
jgi:2-polyprenyl-3-methyl-5-hydroxy-6-metoxy-1,4-benzoquinol methylase